MPRKNRTKKSYRPIRAQDEPVNEKPSAETPGDLDRLAADLVRRGLASPAIANQSHR